MFIDNFGPEKQNRSATNYMTTKNDETIEDISALEQYLKDYDSKNSFSFTGNILYLTIIKLFLNIELNYKYFKIITWICPENNKYIY